MMRTKLYKVNKKSTIIKLTFVSWFKKSRKTFTKPYTLKTT